MLHDRHEFFLLNASKSFVWEKSRQLWIIKIWNADLSHACKRCGRAPLTMVTADPVLSRLAMSFLCSVEIKLQKNENTHVEYIRKIKICTDDDTLNLASVDVTIHEYLIMKTFVWVSLRLFQRKTDFKAQNRLLI